MNDIVEKHPEIESLLEPWSTVIGSDFAGYKGHVYRVFHYCLALVRYGEADDVSKIAIAAVHHDLGIWSHKTMDYLGPSVELASRHLDAAGRTAWTVEVSEMILNHHKIRPFRISGPAREIERLVEPFRRADLIDVSLGRVRFGLDRAYIRDVKAAHPAGGFYGRILRLIAGYGLRHPRRPMPMMKV